MPMNPTHDADRMVETAERACDRARDAELHRLRRLVLEGTSERVRSTAERDALRDELADALRSLRFYRAIVWASFWCSLAAAILKTL